MRAAVAALLNAEALGPFYHETVQQVIDETNLALANDREWMLNTAALLDTYNNAGCPWDD